MRLLLDTHLLLWWLCNDKSLSALARSLIANPENTVCVSAVSHWEIRLKQSLGKLELPSDFDTKLADEPFELLPLTAASATQFGLLPWHHRDPFDRMLVAQAQVENLTLLTADKALTAYGALVKLVK